MKPLNREKYEFPLNIVKDIVENIADKESAKECSLKYACDHFDENVKRHFKGISDDLKDIVVDFYKEREVSEEIFCEFHDIDAKHLHIGIAKAIQAFTRVDVYRVFFVDQELVDITNKLETRYLELKIALEERNAILEKKIEKVKKEIEMLDVRTPRARLENFKLIITNRTIDVLDIKPKTKIKLRANKIEFVNQLTTKTEDEILNITGLSEREAYDVMRALGKLGHDTKQ